MSRHLFESSRLFLRFQHPTALKSGLRRGPLGVFPSGEKVTIQLKSSRECWAGGFLPFVETPLLLLNCRRGPCTIINTSYIDNTRHQPYCHISVVRRKDGGLDGAFTGNCPIIFPSLNGPTGSPSCLGYLLPKTDHLGKGQYRSSSLFYEGR